MDWNMAIEKNREALKRILTALVAMAGLPLGLGGQFTFFPRKGALPQGSALAEKSKLSPVPTLPRHLHRTVLRLLRPAEAATRRLIIVAAREIVVVPPPPPSAVPLPRFAGEEPAPRPAAPWILPRSRGVRRTGETSGSPQRTTKWWRGRYDDAAKRVRRAGETGGSPRQGTAEGGGRGVVEAHSCAMRVPALPLFDPLRRPFHRRRPRATGVPRICVPGYSAPFPLPPRPSPDDPVDAARLALRLQGLARTLDDLPAHARRFARWRANRDAISAQNKNRDATLYPPPCGGPKDGRDPWLAQRRATGAEPRIARRGAAVQDPAASRRGWRGRISPLRLGRPPGWRRRSKHEVHEVLNDVHHLAFWALERPDTS